MLGAITDHVGQYRSQPPRAQRCDTDAFACAGRPGFRARCVVLSDDERKTLLDVERQLMAEDPEFVRSFHDQLRQRPATQGGSNGKIAVAVAMLFSAILLLAGFV